MTKYSPEFAETLTLITVVLVMYVIVYSGFMTQRTFEYFRDTDGARRALTVVQKIYYFALFCQIAANSLLLLAYHAPDLIRLIKMLVSISAVSVLCGTVLVIQTIFIAKPRKNRR